MPADQPEWITHAQRALGKRVSDARRHRNLSQEELAGRAEIDRSSVQRIERGQNDAKFSHLLRVAKVLDLPLRDLIPDDTDDVRPSP